MIVTCCARLDRRGAALRSDRLRSLWQRDNRKGEVTGREMGGEEKGWEKRNEMGVGRFKGREIYGLAGRRLGKEEWWRSGKFEKGASRH